MIADKVGHYQIVRQLGVGGMGEVYLAEDSRLRRQVALKVLPTESLRDDSLERFKREARAVAALNHANIVTIYSVEREGDLNFLTMEYVQGRTLEDSIPESGLPLNRILDIAVPLVDALAAAHRKGVVHRDLKPSNVMITDDGQPKILDFGLAKRQRGDDDEADPTAATELQTRAGMVLGTAPYMSPEQLEGRPVDHRTDLFSMGVMLFEMTTGRRPFRGDSSAQLVSSILRDPPPELSERRQGLPNELGEIVKLCLEKNPEHRFQSADELLRELQSLRTGVLTGAQPARPPVAERRPLPRWLPWTVAAAVVVAALAVLFVVLRPLAPAVDRLTLAILPFVNLTGDPARDYLGQGLSAGLMTQLGEASSVRLVGGAAVWSRSRDPARAVRELGAGSMLEGELQGAADRLLVDVHLTDLGTGLVLWSERFEGDGDSVMDLQREIARRLLGVLSIPLSRRELDRMARDPSRSFEAYEYFLRGFERLETVEGADGAQSAATLFRQALLLDPEFALAHAGLSHALWRKHTFEPTSELLLQAEEAARAALAIDPALPAAQVALARVARSRGRAEESIAQLQGALAGHPKPDEAYRELASSYEQAGDLESAEESLRAAVALQDDWLIRNVLGRFLARHGSYDEARAEFERAAELAPETVGQPQESLATLDLSQGKFDEAVAAFERLPKPIRQGRLAANIGTAYYYSGHPEKWRRAEDYYKLAVELAPRHSLYRGNLADLYRERGRDDEARKSYRIAWALIEEQLEANPESGPLLLRRAEYEAKGGECGSAVRHAAALVLAPPQTGPKAYQLAKVFALCGQTKAALDALAMARDLGTPMDRIGRDWEFQVLTGEPEFQALVASH